MARARVLGELTSSTDVWLGEAGEAWVATGPGVLACGFESIDEIRGDPAAFAVDWSEL